MMHPGQNNPLPVASRRIATSILHKTGFSYFGKSMYLVSTHFPLHLHLHKLVDTS